MPGELAKRLRIKRAGLGITQRVAADEIGISPACLSTLERGGTEPHRHTRLACERWLMGARPKPPPPPKPPPKPGPDDVALAELEAALELALEQLQRVQALVAAARGGEMNAITSCRHVDPKELRDAVEAAVDGAVVGLTTQQLRDVVGGLLDGATCDEAMIGAGLEPCAALEQAVSATLECAIAPAETSVPIERAPSAKEIARRRAENRRMAEQAMLRSIVDAVDFVHECMPDFWR